MVSSSTTAHGEVPGPGSGWFHIRTPPASEPDVEYGPTGFGSVGEYLTARPKDWGLPGGDQVSDTVADLFTETHPNESLVDQAVHVRSMQLNGDGRIDVSVDFEFLSVPATVADFIHIESFGLAVSYKKDRPT